MPDRKRSRKLLVWGAFCIGDATTNSDYESRLTGRRWIGNRDDARFNVVMIGCDAPENVVSAFQNRFSQKMPMISNRNSTAPIGLSKARLDWTFSRG